MTPAEAGSAGPPPEQGRTQIAGDVTTVSHHFSSVQLTDEAARRLFRRSPSPWAMNSESLQRLQRVFVEPRSFERAKDTLRRHGTTVLSGPAGSGRRSAAMMSLFQSAPAWRELPTDPDYDESPWENAAPEQQEGLLLDLSSYPPDSVRPVLSLLDRLRAKVGESEALLAIVLPEDTEHLLDGELRTLHVSIGRPSGWSVFARHLAAESIELPETVPIPEDLAHHLHSERLAELARLASLVSQARSESATGTITGWLNQALEAFGRRAEQVATSIRQHRDGADRALMLVAALLQDATTDAVFQATDELLAALHLPPDERYPIERDGIAERLRALNITVTDRRRVRFPALDYDRAVREHFWNEYPDLRAKLRTWVGRAALLAPLNESSRQNLVLRFAEQCLRTGEPDDLRTLAEEWTGERASPACVEIILEAGLRDERFGAWFRRRIYDWARETELSPTLGLVLIRLCARVIEPSYQDQALVRLHHFARRSNTDVVQAATGQIVELAADDRFFRRLVNRLADRLTRRRDTRDAQLFLRVADPARLVTEQKRSHPLITDRQVRDQLITAWHHVFTKPQNIWDEQVRTWLRAAAEDQRCLPLLDVLIDACDQRIAPLSRLHALARDWAGRSSDERWRRTGAEFVHRIDASQNLEFLSTVGEPIR